MIRFRPFGFDSRRRDADEEKEPWHDALEKRKIFRSTDLGDELHSSRTGNTPECRQHRLGQRGIIHSHRVIAPNVDLAYRVRAAADGLGQILHALMHVVAHLFIESADRAAHLDRIRDDVLAHAALDHADRDDGRFLGDVDLTADDGLQPEHHLCGGDDGIDTKPRHRAVSLAPFDEDPESIGTRHRWSRAIADYTERQPGCDVQPEDHLRLRVLKRALIDHHLRAAVLALW